MSVRSNPLEAEHVINPPLNQVPKTIIRLFVVINPELRQRAHCGTTSNPLTWVAQQLAHQSVTWEDGNRMNIIP